MEKPIEHVAIVGGGTAGWMTAIMMNNALNSGDTDGQRIRVTLIESPDIPTVGVGEATVPGMPVFLKECGVSEEEFFRTCNASFKLGVHFKNWNVDSDGKFIDYFNSFTNAPYIEGHSPIDYFMKYGADGADFAEVTSACPSLTENFKGPRTLADPLKANNVRFAYHLDAGKFAKLLRQKSIDQGVQFIADNVQEVYQNEQGDVSALKLQKIGNLDVDFVIDCTGFSGLIINKTLKEPFLDYSQYLANNRAVAVQIEHKQPNRIEPITTSTALGAGWAWNVPLFNRVGTGYVFSDAYRSDDEAVRDLQAHLGDHTALTDPKFIPLRVGRTRNAWVNNCVAIGLSGGFIEPLESTAIHMVDTTVRWLCINFPRHGIKAPLRDQFNRLSAQLYDEVRDFICLHYALSNRTDDPYWIDARESLTIPESLSHLIELWKYRLPNHYDFAPGTLFTPFTYAAVLLGKRVYENGFGHPDQFAGRRPDRAAWKRYLKVVHQEISDTVANHADHFQLLRAIRGEVKSLDGLNFFAGSNVLAPSKTPPFPWGNEFGTTAPSKTKVSRDDDPDPGLL